MTKKKKINQPDNYNRPMREDVDIGGPNMSPRSLTAHERRKPTSKKCTKLNPTGERFLDLDGNEYADLHELVEAGRKFFWKKPWRGTPPPLTSTFQALVFPNEG